MEREEIIKKIEGLYPTDCEYSDTNKIGEHLLIKAMYIAGFDWRSLPINVLERYLQLCEEEEENGELTCFLRENNLL